MSRIELVVIETHHEVCNMLFALDLLAEELEQIFEVVIEVPFKTVDHSVIVVLFYCLFDVFTLEQDLLLSSSNGINQMCVVFVIIVLEVELVEDVLVLTDEVIDKLTIIAIVLFA